MANPISDEAFARAVNQMGAATFEHIDSAKAAQAEQAQNGVLVSLADVMVQRGMLTPVMRESIEKKLQAQQQGGVKQLGSYKLLKKLGEGGMGAVYLAEDTAMLRKVALKVLPKKYASDPEFLTRFRREAKLAGKLNHVNIISAFTVGEELGNHFYVMEFCEGEPLDKLLKREQVLSWDKAIEIVTQVARGLKHAHEHGIIHRDIKPANIFIASGANSNIGKGSLNGVAKILDMGLSKDIGGTEQSFNTQTGMALGTPHYISPEQAKGERNVDGRTDIYSLGATLYQLITGQTPFQGSTAAMIIMKHLSEQLPNPQDVRDDIPDGVVQVIQKMMAKEPADRYANCAELLADLELVIDGRSPSSLAIDVGKSSIAMPRARKDAAVAAADHIRAARKGATNRHEPVADRRDADRRGSAQNISNAKKNKTPLYIAGGVAGLGVLVFVIALSGSGKKAETALQGDAEPAKMPTPISEPAKPNVIPDETTKTPVTATPPVAGGVDDAWVKSVQALAPEEQVRVVVEKLRELNRAPKITEQHSIQNGTVLSLNLGLHSYNPIDLSPIQALKGLANLRTEHGDIKDLSPLQSLKLNSLEVIWGGRYISSVAPLRNMPLERLAIYNCAGIHQQRIPLSDLSPLKGMKLKFFSCVNSNISDLSPLAGMPLGTLEISGTNVTNFDTLRELPLKEIRLDFRPERDTALLKSIKSLEKINDIPVGEFWAKNAQADGQNKILLSENFEKLDLDKLPTGWELSGKSQLSITEQPGHGKVLKISRKVLDRGIASLTIRLDSAVVNGHSLRASVLAYCPAGYTPAPEAWAQPQVGLKMDKDERAVKNLWPDRRDWVQLVGPVWKVPLETKETSVNLRVPFVAAEVFFDDLVVELDPNPKSLPPRLSAEAVPEPPKGE